MSPKTKHGSPANHAPVPLMNDQTPGTGFTADFQELYSHGMDRALGIEKASLAAVVSLNSCAIDIYRNAFWFVSSLGGLFEMAAQGFASCMELQLSLLTLMGSNVSSTVASFHGMQVRLTAEVLESSMDIAMGARHVAAPSSTVASSSGRKAQTTAEVSASSMDIAIGAQGARGKAA
jgi:hypothetical protein